MSGRFPRRRASLLTVIALVAALAPAGSALGVTKSQVDRACASSAGAYDAYLAAQAEFQRAAGAYEAAALDVENVLYRQKRTAETVEIRQSDMVEARDRFQQQAVEAYMSGGNANPALFFMASSLDEVITSNEFLSAAAADERDSAGALAALQGELTVLQGQLVVLEGDLREVESERLAAKDAQEQAMLADQAAWEKLSGQCRELRKQYEVELARAAAARGGGAGGVSSAATPGFRCPFPGSSFIDSWGAARSGGRRHKGTDMMGPYGAPLYAVANGVAYTSTSSLGGRSVWLVADYGVGFYYAHLSGYNVSSGGRVSTGEVVGFNGDSGNARGGAPHLHFEIHPGGRGSAAVNPYPTLVAACR
ncbi:MAG: murein hydrolase activator EnvC family protein [Acidimicrobiia bacterium]